MTTQAPTAHPGPGASTPLTVVTGASTGIGRAVALRQARAGDRVRAIVREPDACGALRDEARAEGLDLRLVAADLTDEEASTAAFAGILSADGPVDRLVCNAGRFVGAPLEDLALDEIRAVFEINYFGALRAIQAVLPGMRAHRRGTIVALSSQSAAVVLPTWAAYSASKRALEASLEALAMETAELGIRVAIVQPGSTRTAMREKITPRHTIPDYDAMQARYRAAVEADRETGMVPDDVATVVASVLEDPDAPLRTAVGVDAHRNLARRRSLDDAAWVRMFASGSIEDMRDRWLRSG